MKVRLVFLHVRRLPSLRLRAQLHLPAQRIHQHQLPALRPSRKVNHEIDVKENINIIYFYIQIYQNPSCYTEPIFTEANWIILCHYFYFDSINTPRSSMNTPYHCGFFLTIWDRLFNTCYPADKECFCAECARYCRV